MILLTKDNQSVKINNMNKCKCCANNVDDCVETTVQNLKINNLNYTHKNLINTFSRHGDIFSLKYTTYNDNGNIQDTLILYSAKYDISSKKTKKE